MLLSVSVTALIVLRLTLMGFSAPDFSPSDNPASDSDCVWTRGRTLALLPALNLYLLLCPRTLSFDWSMSAVPLVDRWTDARNLLTSAFYAALILMTCRVVRDLDGAPPPSAAAAACNGHCAADDVGGPRWKCRRRRPVRGPLLLLSLTLLTIPFVPATNLFFYVGFVVAERVLYVPSTGYCLLIAVAVDDLVNRCIAGRRAVSPLAAAASRYWPMTLLVTSLALRTWIRNADWLNEEALYRSGIAVNPAKGRSKAHLCQNIGLAEKTTRPLCSTADVFCLLLQNKVGRHSVHGI